MKLKQRDNGSYKMNLNQDELDLIIKLVGSVRLGKSDSSIYPTVAYRIITAIEKALGTEAIDNALLKMYFDIEIEKDNGKVREYSEAEGDSICLTVEPECTSLTQWPFADPVE